MRRSIALAILVVSFVAGPALAQTAIELKKELLPQMKKAQAEGKDVGQAQQFFNEGDKALKDGLQDEATEAFKKAKAAMPKD